MNIVAGTAFLHAALELNTADNLPDGHYPQSEDHTGVGMRLDNSFTCALMSSVMGRNRPFIKVRPQSGKGPGKVRDFLTSFPCLPY
ncbi:hypothetical protein LNO55_27280 [Klebsiella pneumoniae subsp. pneumoniae]|nr:hypothetical protein [Klebsiella pneumoniae subsp. pneumoniae]